jgi:hypothetical protein
MAKIANPVRFSDYFSVAPALLSAAGVLDPTLNVDTGLFIDPLLLERSRHAEMKEGARRTYEDHFATVIKLLRASKAIDDVPWRNSARLLSFPEIKWTCLGYGAASVSGSGSGSDMTSQVISTAKAIVDLGVEDPDLFVAMALFEEGFGPDRISDMATNVILRDLLAFNARILPTLNVPQEALTLRLRNGRTFDASLPVNPFVRGESPVVLVPLDILRDLPIARDWSDVADAASKNEELRNRVNDQIAKLWTAKTLQDKAALKQWAMSGTETFTSLLDMLHSAKGQPYDTDGDPKGELFWRRIATTLAAQEPLTITAPARLDLAGVTAVVEQIIDQFRFLIENRRFSEELYHGNEVRPEKAAQRLFFAVAYAYCKANNLDITPEADTGNGPVDFKVASGFIGRVLVEIKLSTNTKLLRGYSRQLKVYKEAEETVSDYYVVIDVGKMGKKARLLQALKNKAAGEGARVSPIVFIDGIRKPSASKL